MLLTGEAQAQRIVPLTVAAPLHHGVDSILIARIDRVERLAAVIEVELVGVRVGKGGREVALEGR